MAFATLALAGATGAAPQAQPVSGPTRLLVKFRAPMADRVEAALPASLRIGAGKTGEPAVDSLVARHHLKGLRR